MWIFIALGVAVLLYYLFKSNRFDYWEKRGIPTASGCEWFFGHMRPMLFLKKHMVTAYKVMYSEYPEAPAVGIYMMNSPLLLVRDPELIKTILISEFNHFSGNGFIVDKAVDKLVAWNPFFLKEEEWKRSRGHATPSVSVAKLKGYLPNILKVGDELVNYVKEHCVDSIIEIDAKTVSAMFTTDVMANAICGVENNSFKEKDSLFSTITHEISNSLDTSVMKNIKVMLLQLLPFLNKFFVRVGFVSNNTEALLMSLTRKIIQDRTLTGEKRNDVYQVMMTFRENDKEGIFTDEYITSQVFTIMLDLYETSSEVLAAALFVLAWHPEVQQKLRSQIQELKRKTNGEYSIEDIESFKYLDMVFSESMRVYTPFAALHRECTSECTLNVPCLKKPLKISKGTIVHVPISGLNSDPKYYPDPEKFDPERFSDEEVDKRPKFTFLPFGDGPKKCLGFRIASLQIKVALMKIIESFNLKPCAKSNYPLDVDPKGLILARPTYGAWIYFEELK